MKILLTGKDGFIGKSLLKDKDFLSHDITAIDKEQSQLDDLKNIFNNQKFNFLIHLASTMTPNKSNSNILDDLENDIFHAIKLFDLAIKKKTECIIFISSAGALGSYGDEKPSIKSVYALSKFFIENFLKLNYQNSDTKILNLRLSNLYGPEQIFKNNQGVIPNFYDHICSDRPIDVWGDGNSKKDYLFIEDFVNLMNRILRQGPSSGSFDVGSGISYSLNQIIDMFSDIFLKKINVNYIKQLASDHSDMAIDISSISNEFDWKPLVSLKEGIHFYSEWVKSHEK